MTPLVLLETTAGTPVERLLDALGAVFERRSLAHALQFSGNSPAARPALILSEEELSNVCGGKKPAEPLKELLSRYGHVLVYPFRGTAEGLHALNACVQGRAEAAPVSATDGPYAVARGFAAAGPFAGLSVSVADHGTDRRVSIRRCPHSVQEIISVGGGALLVKVTLPTTEVFIAASTAVFDVEAELSENLAVERCFSAIVPLLLFLRHSRAAFWRTEGPAANVIIDDVNLRPRYGFVNVRTLARHVDELGCAVSIGFIPWNCNRTSPGVVDLFRARWPRLSLSIHGCDHIGAEFSTSSASASRAMIGLSLGRMQSLAKRSGIRYDRVIIFPQGRFSRGAMDALRESSFEAAVNTELVDHRTQRGVRAGELLGPAITSYGGFPLFLRRKPSAHIANFALDLLLGKPCLVVTHHDDFRAGMEPFVSLVGALKALEPTLRWTNLETIVSGTYSSRPNPAGGADVRLVVGSSVFASAGVQEAIRFSKAEPLLEKEFEMWLDGQQVKGHRSRAEIVFSAVLAPEGPTVVEVRASPPEPTPMSVRPLAYSAKVAARRYLSEFRDNYVARSSWATAAVRRIRGSRLAGATR
jgi:hypothetical protein